MLERSDIAGAAIDLDGLQWFHVPGLRADAARRTYLANVGVVVGNALDAGVRHVVLAVALHDRRDVDDLAEAARVPLRVVRLEVPGEGIVRRLAADVTTGRRHDLEVAVEWLTTSTGVGVEDLCVRNDGSIQEAATEILTCSTGPADHAPRGRPIDVTDRRSAGRSARGSGSRERTGHVDGGAPGPIRRPAGRTFRR